MAQPLPPNTYPSESNLKNYCAYNKCLAFETTAAVLPDPPSGPKSLVCARLLGYMIIHAPTEIGRENISNEILDCTHTDQLRNLAIFYIDYFVRCFRANKGRTPTPSSHPSRPSFDYLQMTVKPLLITTPKDHSMAKLMALKRDGFRCIITGAYDQQSYETIDDVRTTVRDDPSLRVQITQAAHILAPSTSQDITDRKEDGPKHNYAASAWAVMERFGQVSVSEELNGPAIHRLQNIMTMEMSVHSKFDHLAIWLEETPVLNVYTLGAKDPVTLRGYPATVAFASTDPDLPLPDPRYLALHAACAKVAHLSGAGEYIETIFRDMDNMTVLATNGSSVGVLEYALCRRTDILVA